MKIEWSISQFQNSLRMRILCTYMYISPNVFRKCKRIILDFRRSNPNDMDELKTQLNILDNGYAVDLSKVSNSLLQGTLSVIFSILELPATNRGYFWNEEDNEGKRVFDLLGDCFEDDISELERSLKGDVVGPSSDLKGKDTNEIDLDLDDEDEDEEDGNGNGNGNDLDEQYRDVSNNDQDDDEEEVYIGPTRPPPPVFVTSTDNTSNVIGNSDKSDKSSNFESSIGPVIPKEILEMINQGIPVQMEEENGVHYYTTNPDGRRKEEDEEDNEDNLIGPSLPGRETRIPTEDAYAQIDRLAEEEKNKTNPKRVCALEIRIPY